VIFLNDSQPLSATTTATAAPRASTTSGTATTATEAPTATTEATAATIEGATARSHAGEATIAVAACVGSIESPGTAAESIAVTCTAARNIATAYAIRSAGAQSGATGPTRATNASCAIAKTCRPRRVA
jgi:hypothetical protein